MKIAKMALVLILVLLLLAGCGAGPTEPEVPEDPGTYFGGVDAKAVMVEVTDGRPVLWEEILYDLVRVRDILESIGPIDDWDAIFEGQPLFEEEVTYNEFSMLYAVEGAMARRAVVQMFEEINGELDPDFAEEMRNLYMEHMGLDEDEFAAHLAETHQTEELFLFVREISAMFGQIQEAHADVTDAQLDAFIEEAGILRAKHILLQVPDGEDDPDTTALIWEIYEELADLTGDELFARFEELLAEYGEDPGMLMNPEGYTFVPGVMVPEFTVGTQVLDLGALGEPIRAFHGYHIILRLPVQHDAIVMMPGGAPPQPLVSMILPGLMQRLLDEAIEAIRYEKTALFFEIVPSEIFALLEQEDEQEDES